MAHLEQHIIGLLHSIRVIRNSYDAATTAAQSNQHNHRQPFDDATAAEYDYWMNHNQHHPPGSHAGDQEHHYSAADTPSGPDNQHPNVHGPGQQQHDNPGSPSQHDDEQQNGDPATATPPEHNNQNPYAQDTGDHHDTGDHQQDDHETTTPSEQDNHVPYAPDNYLPNRANYYMIRRYINDALRRGRSACRPLPNTYEPNLTPWFDFQEIVNATSANLGIPNHEVIHYLDNNNSHIRIWYHNAQPRYVAMKKSSRRAQ